MKKLTIILSCLFAAFLFACEEKKENVLSVDVTGYVVEKEIVLAHCDTAKPVIQKASVFAFSSVHVSPHPSFHRSFHSSSHVSSHRSHDRNMYHPVYHPLIYGFRPHSKIHKIEDKTITFIGNEFDIYVADKFSINKVSVDSALFLKLERGQKVHFKNGIYQNI
jgi:hypothetical protein